MKNPTLCSIDGCDRPSSSRTWCGAHYRRWRLTGNTGSKPLRRKRVNNVSLEEALRWHGWTVTETGCWEWNGTILKRGYGSMGWGGRNVTTHRLAYEVWVGPIPEGYVVRHKCDNKPCMNPRHLETGTQTDNIQDREDRGRSRYALGEAASRTKLTEVQVLEIRARCAEGAAPRKLSKEYGVTSQTILDIRNRKSWKWLESEQKEEA